VEKERPIISKEYLFVGPAGKKREKFEDFFGNNNKLPFPSRPHDLHNPIVCGYFYGVTRFDGNSKNEESYAIKVCYQGGSVEKVFRQTQEDKGEYEELARAGFEPFFSAYFFFDWSRARR